MMDDFDYIGAILEDADALEILEKVVLQKASPKTILNPKDAKEKEVQDFIEKNGRDPSLESSDISEKLLAMRLKAMKERQPLDQGEELKEEPINPWDSDEGLDILANVDLGNTSINDFSGSEIIRKMPAARRKEVDEVAHAKPCPNFSDYKHLFDEVSRAIAQGRRKLIPYQRGEICKGQFYVRRGLMFYVEEVFEVKKNPRTGDFDGRTHCIFANGTESNLLLQSIRRSMNDEGYAVTEEDSSKDFNLFSEKQGPEYNAGFIYILNTLSSEPEVKQFKDLHKIGFTRGKVEDRIKNARKETTYLCGDVGIADKWKCSDLNPQKLENLVHVFFASANVKIKVKDEHGHFAIADEWYDVPLMEIRKIVPLILNRTLGQYYYDSKQRKVLHR